MGGRRSLIYMCARESRFALPSSKFKGLNLGRDNPWGAIILGARYSLGRGTRIS